ncbi:MAG: C1 family peptidase [Pseudomonadota bacterium]
MSVSILVDLRNQFGPVRDQGARPTCLAFAASDAHAALRGNWDELSCEYAFYHAQKRTGRSPDKGSFLPDMLASLRDTGQPIESGWPYLKKLPADMATYRPPHTVGQVFARNGDQALRDVGQICAELNDGRPAIVLSVLTRSFFRPQQTGVIDHIQNDEVFPVPRHAVVAVGHGLIGQQRAVLIRNSWGPTWGLQGHGWLTENYLTRHMYDLAVLKEDRHVPDNSAAA